MKNIVVRHNTFSGTDTGLRFKSSEGRGGKTERIFISDIYMNDIKDQAIVFETTYFDNYVGAAPREQNTPKEPLFLPDFGDIHISRVVCRGTKTGIKASGVKGMVHDVTVENSTFFYTNKSTDIGTDCDVKIVNVDFHTF